MSEHENQPGPGKDATAGQPDDGGKRKRKRRGGRGRRSQGEGGQAEARSESRRDQGAQDRSGPPRRRRSRSAAARPAEARSGETRSRETRSTETRSTEARSGEARSSEARTAEARTAETRSGEAGTERRRRRRRRRDASPDSAPAAVQTEAGQDDPDGKRPRRRRRVRERTGTEPARRSRRAAEAPEPDDGLAAALDRDDGAATALDREPYHAPAEPYGPHEDDDDDVFDRESTRAAEDDDPSFFAGLDRSDAIALPEPDADDPDPVSFGIEDLEVDDRAALATGVRNLVGVKFSAAGRIYVHDSGDEHYQRGEEVVVEGERGTRVGTVAVASMRQTTRKQSLPRVLRRPNPSDRRAVERAHERSERALELARELTRSLELPMKVFRASHAHSGKKVTIYFTSEERIDFRDLVRRLTTELHSRVEMRQTGVRDEAKYVGGIGSCGRELCCTTWLPEFVPVSIKMAKVQGMVLNPTKVSGQCGRLKCCLVYEQATYAEMRKGLPKLGKRVLTEDGEGRVVEVDVLRQRVRVSLGPGEFRVFAGDEVQPMFPPQPGKPTRK